jgi:NADH-quinone oxidoreductase subunit M
MNDIDTRELWLLAPIAAVVLWMGVYPESFLAAIRRDVSTIVERIDRAAPAGDSRLKLSDSATKQYRVSGHEKDNAAEGSHQ